MRLARLADIPVVAIDIPITGATYFGSDHDGIGMMAGHALGEWIEKHWSGQLDEVLLLGGETSDRPAGSPFVQEGAREWDDVPLRLAPATRLDAALDALRPLVEPIPTIRPLSCPQAWATSQHAVDMFEQLLDTVLPTLPADCRVAAICIVNEYALGLAKGLYARPDVRIGSWPSALGAGTRRRYPSCPPHMYQAKPVFDTVM